MKHELHNNRMQLPRNLVASSQRTDEMWRRARGKSASVSGTVALEPTRSPRGDGPPRRNLALSPAPSVTIRSSDPSRLPVASDMSPYRFGGAIRRSSSKKLKTKTTLSRFVAAPCGLTRAKRLPSGCKA